METKANDQLFEFQSHAVVMDPVLHKLSPDQPNHNWKSACTRLKAFLKRVGVLLTFHLLNILVAIGSAVFLALMLASLALLPCWVMAEAMVVLVQFVVERVQQIQSECWRYFGYSVLVALYLMVVVTIIPCLILVTGTFCTGFFYVSVAVMKCLVNADVRLANFITSRDPHSTDDGHLDPAEGAERFERRSDQSDFLLHANLSRRGWVGVLYFGVVKIVIGVLSVVAITLAVIQPVVVICSGGRDDLLVDKWVTSHKDAWEYSGILLLLWVIGAVGLVALVPLAVTLTHRVCGVWKSEQQSSTDDGVPITPVPDSSSTGFTEINPASGAER